MIHILDVKLNNGILKKILLTANTSRVLQESRKGTKQLAFTLAIAQIGCFFLANK